MIIGEYPCCEAPLLLDMSGIDRPLPAFMKDTCEHCGAVVWHKISRLNPESYTEDEFNRRYEVNEETHAITEKIK